MHSTFVQFYPLDFRERLYAQPQENFILVLRTPECFVGCQYQNPVESFEDDGEHSTGSWVQSLNLYHHCKKFFQMPDPSI